MSKSKVFVSRDKNGFVTTWASYPDGEPGADRISSEELAAVKPLEFRKRFSEDEHRSLKEKTAALRQTPGNIESVDTVLTQSWSLTKGNF